MLEPSATVLRIDTKVREIQALTYLWYSIYFPQKFDSDPLNISILLF